MIRFYILCKRFFLKRKGLSDAKVVSITEKESGFPVHLLLRFNPNKAALNIILYNC